MADTVISVRGLAKRYTLGDIGTGSLVRDLQSWWARRGGRDDPNASIGSERSGAGTIWAIREMDFSVGAGEAVGIVGGNGAGKSTLLKVLTRITRPTAGEIRLRGRVASMLEVGTGFHPDLTGRENVFLNGAILGMSRAEVRGKFDEILEFSEIGRFIDTPVKRYSSGMYVRLAFAVAAHLEPEIMLVDEVLAVGDASFKQKCLAKMAEVVRGGRTILFVSHNMRAIRELCPRTLLLEGGRIVHDGDTATALRRYLNISPSEDAVVQGEGVRSREHLPVFDGHRRFDCDAVSLTDSRGRGRLAFSSDEEIVVRVDFTCHEAVPELNVIVSLASETGDVVLRSESMDQPGQAAYPAGRHTLSCRIPPDLFGEKTLSLTVALHCYGEQHVNLRDIMVFTVSFAGYNARTYTRYDKTLAFFRPQLAWEAASRAGQEQRRASQGEMP